MQAKNQWFFNIFQAATHFATQFNLATPSEIYSQTYEMQLCLHNRKSQTKK